MTKRALIIGYGRAGKRHAKLCDEYGIEWHFTDITPVGDQRFRPIGEISGAVRDYDFAIVATPPDQHLAAIKACLDAHVFVLCEKPLCGAGQLEEAEWVPDHPLRDMAAVAYNYRYHPAIIKAKEAGNIYPHRPILMFSSTYRPEMPAWGQVLDHLSHAFDTLRFLMNDPVAVFEVTTDNQRIEVNGFAGGREFQVIDHVSGNPKTLRDVFLLGPWGMTYLNDMNDIDTMYHQMFDDFLNLVNGQPSNAIKLADALETQRLIQEVLDCD